DREREMLRILSQAPGETVPRLSLAGNSGSVSERAVDVQVNRLRRKIERNPANPLFVQTVRGIGYRLVITSLPASTSRMVFVQRLRVFAKPGSGMIPFRPCGRSIVRLARSLTVGDGSVGGSTAACRKGFMPARC